ncbi:hypothetical protein ABH920_006388 [Catenulispora sp. EB89]|uniref:hypothetical protein n=1 Tax=Catenulispora sp. EB89 TaxID=3156257 RepID=UPI003515C2B4
MADDGGDGYTAIVNDLNMLWGAIRRDGAAWSRVLASAKSASTTTGSLSNTAVGMDNTVSAVYTQFQAVSIGGSAFKFDINDWLADRKSRLATGGTKGGLGKITGGKKVAEKAEDVYKAVFPHGTDLVNELYVSVHGSPGGLESETRRVRDMATETRGKVASIQRTLERLPRTMTQARSDAGRWSSKNAAEIKALKDEVTALNKELGSS